MYGGQGLLLLQQHLLRSRLPVLLHVLSARRGGNRSAMTAATRCVLVLAAVLACAGCGDVSSGSDGGAGSGGTGGSGGGGGAGGPDAGPACGFIPCPSQLFCADDPNDGCDPMRGGAECTGICVSCAPGGSAEGVRCGAQPCAAGEWRDTSFSAAPTCRCGNTHASCTAGDRCGSFGPSFPGQCGTICCGVSRVCPF